ncbi:ABC transporter permease [Paracoccus sp. PS-1]|uniref:ABC transporter permease n=1 Tax=unclassified Paracoccus (in: a-proteobacteria) TaxID=2688777 RepID=UPI00049179A0|nr:MULTISPECIES: ABC transporter permease [unclassified Paracoccus (in: a-proteobacteria)]MDQ7260685.1 ABC transporter permease [Paracoccus sp. PS1]UFM65655.1 ABC transporter permease [Paracoccus sp. MA]
MIRMLKTMPPTAILGVLVIAAYAVIALFAPLLAPHAEAQIVGAQFEPWSAAYPLGTDTLGRDMLSRLIWGARNTVGVALVTTALAFGIGAIAGLLAAALGGWVDLALSRLVDVLMAVPALILTLLALSALGPGVANLVVVVAILDSTRVFRLARATAMNVMVMDYVEAAQLRGEGTWWIISREVLPNISAPLIAEFGLRFCFVFLTISALSFLGLGLPPPMADWGAMVRDNAALITFGDITPLLPAACIAVLTVSVNFVVDWMLHRASGLKD